MSHTHCAHGGKGGHVTRTANATVGSIQMSGAGAFVQEPIPYGPYPGLNAPRAGSFTVRPNTVVLMRAASSAWRAAAPNSGCVDVVVDTNILGTICLWFNTANEHLTLVPRTFILTGLAPGEHTVVLFPAPGTNVDAQDFSQVVVEQYPR